MRELTILFEDIEGMDSTWKGFHIRSSLRTAGFDLSRKIFKEYDKTKREFVFKQSK